MSTTDFTDGHADQLSAARNHPTRGDLRHSPTYWAHRSRADSPPEVDLEERMRLLQQHGSFTLAYAVATQPHLQYFGGAAGVMAFRQRRGLTFVLGDPLCPAEQRRDLLARFLQVHRRPSFVQIGYETAADLESLGLWINEIGFDVRIDLARYDFKGKDKEWLRYADNWVARRRFAIREFSLVELETQVAEVSEAWRSTRQIKRKEVRFLNRPIVMEDEPGVRRFGIFDSGDRLEAFVSFDPLYAQGQTIGYVTCIKRRRPDANPYAEPAIMKRALEQFQAEGLRELRLGLAPLASIEDNSFRANRWLSRWLQYYFRAGWVNRWYHVQGHAQYKRRFRGSEEKVYYASPARFNGFRLLTLASLCGIF